MTRDNAGQRVLNARRVLCGEEESLENTFGGTLPDGAQCFVIEAQANYRYVKHCNLPEDGEYIVMPRGDKQGRWMRAEGLVGFALLEGGKITDDHWNFTGYTYQKVVQFEVTPEALIYIGSIPRIAHLSAEAQGTEIEILLGQGAIRTIGLGKSASGAALIHPGAKIVVNAKEAVAGRTASLQVVLA